MKVFISSTSSGLQSHRQLVAALLEGWYGVNPIYQENLPPDHGKALDYLTRLIDNCDRVICIIGPYLGCCPINQPPDQRRSFTQIEYDIANRLGKQLYIFDARDCLDLDHRDQSEQDRELQEIFCKTIERQEERLWRKFETKAELVKNILQLIRNWESIKNSQQPEWILPALFHRWRNDIQDRAKSLTTLGNLLDFVVCMAAAEVKFHTPMPVSEVEDLLECASHDAFISDLNYQKFISIYKWHKRQKYSRTYLHSEAIKSFNTALELLHVLKGYLLVCVKWSEQNIDLLIYQGVASQQWEYGLKPFESLAPESYHGEVHLLDIRRKQSFRLSPHIQPLPDDLDVLCMWYRESSEEPDKLLRFDNGEPVNAPPYLETELPSTADLLDLESWQKLEQLYPPNGRKIGRYFGEWRSLEVPNQSRNLLELFTAFHDDHKEPLAGLWLAKTGQSKTVIEYIERQFDRWDKFSKLNPDLFGHVRHVESGVQPGIVAEIPEVKEPLSKPLARYLAPGKPKLDIKSQQLHRLVHGVVKICQSLALQDVRLIHCSPADLYWDGNEHCQLFGLGGTLMDGDSIPQDKVLWDIWAGDELPIIAPELEEGARASIASEMFAIGTLIQRCRREPLSYKPSGKEDEVQNNNMRDTWRNDPLECFIFHCLSRNPHRRFMSWDSFLSFFEICTSPNAADQLARPEMIPLGDENGLRISRCQINNFQYERFCQSKRQKAPAHFLSWNYATPFAPVVGVSIFDCEEYCEWLRNEYGGMWRLPTAAEWVAAAGEEIFPWGNEMPTTELANFKGLRRGPIVVGSHPIRNHRCEIRDMAGNVWEWCSDRTPYGPWRILKGGSFASPSCDLEIKAENHRVAAGRYVDVGFRVIQERG